MTRRGAASVEWAALAALLAAAPAAAWLARAGPAADLHDLFERGSLGWDLVHDNRWMFTLFLGVGLGVASRHARALLRSGLAEWRAWRDERRH